MKIQLNQLSKRYALTNKQLVEYFANNGVSNVDIDGDIDITSPKIKALIEKLDAKNRKNHQNSSSLKSLKILGLFGKYDYSFDFYDDVNIWVSQNGAGKTTILTIIVAILTGRFEALEGINFKKIIVEIENKEYTIEKINSKERDKKLKYKSQLLLDDIYDVVTGSLKYRISRELIRNGYIGKSSLSAIRRYLILRGRDFKETIEILNELEEMHSSNLDIKEIKNIGRKFKGEVVFYPTYRRIEVPFDRLSSSDMNFNKYHNSFPFNYMAFGMKDVEDCIESYLRQLKDDTTVAYTNMNAKLLSKFLGYNGEDIPDSIAIDERKVEVVINRIGEERIENIDRLRSILRNNKEHKMDKSYKEFIIYYLQSLVGIYDSQAAIDNKLKKFSDVCSKYLVDKTIKYDETLLTMNVFDSNHEKIEFDDLSSGEKQIVGIFSKVYLDVIAPCILIIDEPEISLSIEWQKEFLKDIYESEKVALLIATTHSPFIFKNEYMKYATDIGVYKENYNESN